MKEYALPHHLHIKARRHPLFLVARQKKKSGKKKEKGEEGPPSHSKKRTCGLLFSPPVNFYAGRAKKKKGRGRNSKQNVAVKAVTGNVRIRSFALLLRPVEGASEIDEKGKEERLGEENPSQARVCYASAAAKKKFERGGRGRERGRAAFLRGVLGRRNFPIALTELFRKDGKEKKKESFATDDLPPPRRPSPNEGQA